MIKRVRLQGHELQPEHQVIACVQVLLVPHVYDVGLLPVNHEGGYGRYGPADRPLPHLMLPPLLFGAPDDAERLDAVPYYMNNIVKAEGPVFMQWNPKRLQFKTKLLKRLSISFWQNMHFEFRSVSPLIFPRPVMRVQIEQEFPPEGLGVGLEGHAGLQARQQVVERGQVDQRVHARADLGAAAGAGPAARAEDAVPVQAHHEGQVAVVDRVRQLEHLLAVGLRQEQLRDYLLDPVRLVVLRLGRHVPRLAVRVGLEVPQQRGAVVDAGVRRVVQRGREPALGRERPGVHDDLGEARAVDAGEQV